MPIEHDSWAVRLRARWIRPNAARFVRPDSQKFMRPDAVRYRRPTLERKDWEDQPRVPAGDPEGGQWTAEGGTVEGWPWPPLPFIPALVLSDVSPDGWLLGEQYAQIDNIFDSEGRPYYVPKGHHEMPGQTTRGWPDLRPETLKTFRQATTGPIPGVNGFSADGRPLGHFWNGPNGAHAKYNDAVQNLADRYLEKNGLRSRDLTPVHANEILKEIRESKVPAIRDYNAGLRYLQRVFRLRGGRGSE